MRVAVLLNLCLILTHNLPGRFGFGSASSEHAHASSEIDHIVLQLVNWFGIVLSPRSVDHVREHTVLC